MNLNVRKFFPKMALMGCGIVLFACSAKKTIFLPDMIALLRRHDDIGATYRSAKYLLTIGQLTSAQERFLRVASFGKSDFFVDAVTQLVADPGFPKEGPAMTELSDQLPKLPLEFLTKETQERLKHLIGVYFLRSGQIPKAAAIFSKLPNRPGSQYLYGIILLRQGNRDKAINILERTVKLARESNQTGVAELAILALGRTAYEERQIAKATKYYSEIPPESPHFFRARQELGWVFLETGKVRMALIQNLILRAPALRRYFRADAYVVESACLLTLCKWDEARSLALIAQSFLNKKIKEVTKFLRIRPDMRLYYIEATASIAKRGEELSQDMGRVLLADAGFRRAFSLIRQIQRERRGLLEPRADELRQLLAEELEKRLVRAQQQAGNTVKRLLTNTLAEFRELRQRSREILFELDRPKQDRTSQDFRSSGSIDDPGIGLKEVNKPSPPRKRGQQRWPFASEYWTDEINSYQLNIKSFCQ